MKNQLILGDCLEIMKEIPDKSIDLILADPPYNISNSNSNLKMSNNKKLKGFGGEWKNTNENWDKFLFQDYVDFIDNFLKIIKIKMKKNSSAWLFGTYHNIGIINFLLQKNDFKILNEVIWFKRNAFPNLSCKRLTASHENILWFCLNETKDYYFNYEYCVNLFDEYSKLKEKNKQLRDVWDIPNNKNKNELIYGKHPTQKPERLIERILKMSTKENDLVLVPFMGSGTECVVSKKLQLNYIGIEINELYFNIAKKRLNNLKF